MCIETPSVSPLEYLVSSYGGIVVLLLLRLRVYQVVVLLVADGGRISTGGRGRRSQSTNVNTVQLTSLAEGFHQHV